MIFVKNWTFLPSPIFFEKDYTMFKYVLNKKKKLPRLQKCHFNILEKCPLFKIGKRA